MKTSAPQLPHSWSLDRWPESIFPGDTQRAKYLLRAHRRALVEAGCVARIGRTLVVFGAPYRKWLERRAARELVPGFEIAANRSRTEQRADRGAT